MVKKDSRAREIYTAISVVSPLFEFWASSQDREDNQKRLLKMNRDIQEANELFGKEPYKWEILYQYLCRQIYKGNLNALKGFLIIINMLSDKSRVQLINDLKVNSIINEEIGDLIETKDFLNRHESKIDEPYLMKISRLIFVLIAIFSNPYNIPIRSKKRAIYEHTGYLLRKLRLSIGSKK